MPQPTWWPCFLDHSPWSQSTCEPFWGIILVIPSSWWRHWMCSCWVPFLGIWTIIGQHWNQHSSSWKPQSGFKERPRPRQKKQRSRKLSAMHGSEQPLCRFKAVFFTGTLAFHLLPWKCSIQASHSAPQWVAFFKPGFLMVKHSKVASNPFHPSKPPKSHLHWSAKLSSMSWQATPQVIAGSGNAGNNQKRTWWQFQGPENSK